MLFDVNKISLGDYNRLQYIEDAMKAAGYILLGRGRHRITYMAPHKRFVLKFALSRGGLEASEREAYLWSEYLNHPDRFRAQLAPCRLIAGQVLMMRTVVELYGDTTGCEQARKILGGQSSYESRWDVNTPDWASNIDCHQVGLLANGKLVAYDYGTDL